MVATLTADAVDRETAWLTTSGDGLPALLATAGGLWDNVQAYFPRDSYSQQRTIYVLRHRVQQKRIGAQRVMATYPFRLILYWPLLDGEGSAESDQRLFDVALDQVLQRVLGPLGDKTHGGRFLSVAESGTVEIDYDNVEQTIPHGYLRAELAYTADDQEINA